MIEKDGEIALTNLQKEIESQLDKDKKKSKYANFLSKTSNCSL